MVARFQSADMTLPLFARVVEETVRGLGKLAR